MSDIAVTQLENLEEKSIEMKFAFRKVKKEMPLLDTDSFYFS